MEKVRSWCGQPSDRGRLNRTKHYIKLTTRRTDRQTDRHRTVDLPSVCVTDEAAASAGQSVLGVVCNV